MATEFTSIAVEESLPPLIITMPRTDAGTPIIHVEGMSIATAMEIPWGELIKLVRGVLSSGSGGSDGKGCTSVKITNADGSSTTITQCPAKA